MLLSGNRLINDITSNLEKLLTLLSVNAFNLDKSNSLLFWKELI